MGQPLGTGWEYEGTILNTFGNMEIQKKSIINFFYVQGWGTGVRLGSGFANLNISSTNKSWVKVILRRIWIKFLPIFIRNMMWNVLWRWSNKVDPWHYNSKTDLVFMFPKNQAPWFVLGKEFLKNLRVQSSCSHDLYLI